MAKKKTVKATKEIEPVEKAVDSTEEPFVPEVVDVGVTRDEKKETPMDLVNSTVRKRPEGNWKKVTDVELAALEEKGVLIGYDSETQEALIKEK